MPKQTFQLALGRFSFVLLLFVSLLLTSCSSDPSESEGRKYLEDRGNNTQIYKLRSFTKTNGLGDEKRYKLEYEAEVECLQSTAHIPGTMFLWPEGPRVSCDRAGQTAKTKGTLVFEKTENGWRVIPGESN